MYGAIIKRVYPSMGRTKGGLMREKCDDCVNCKNGRCEIFCLKVAGEYCCELFNLTRDDLEKWDKKEI